MSRFNQAYWDRFYAANEHIPTTPSSFAQLVFPWLESSLATCTLVELGCGNGRDALWFAQRGVQRVLAVDLSHSSIARLQEAVTHGHAAPTSTSTSTPEEEGSLTQHVRFIEADFSALPLPVSATPLLAASGVRVVYSRFTLHAIDAPSQARALQWAYSALDTGGLLAIEVRSVLGSLYGQGTPVEGERDAFVCGHYRRFLRREELLRELSALGFSIAHEEERAGVAVFGDDDPVVLRVIARK